MLDFADAVAINKFERRGAEDALRDVRRQMRPQPRGVRRRPDGRCRCSAPSPSRFNDDGVTALVPAPARRARRARPADGRRARCAAVADPRSSTRRRRDRPARARPATWPRSPRPSAATTPPPPPQAGGRPPRASSSSRPSATLADAGRRRTDDVEALPAAADARARRRRRRRCSTAGRPPSRPTRATSTSPVLEARRCAPARPRVAVGHARAHASRCPASATTASCCGCLREREPARPLPVHGRRVPVQARGRGPGPDVRRRGRRRPHQPALPPARRGPARDPPVDRVRLGHALRLRPRRAPRHLRQGRQLGRVDRHPRRHEGAVRRVRPVRPDDVGVDDDQRPGADDPRHVPQHRDRPAARPRSPTEHGREPDRRRGRRDPGRTCCAPCGARCRPTSSRRTRARTPASSPPSSRSG